MIRKTRYDSWFLYMDETGSIHMTTSALVCTIKAPYLYSKTLPVSADRFKFFEVSHFLWLLSPLPLSVVRGLCELNLSYHFLGESGGIDSLDHTRLISSALASPSCPFCPQIILPLRSQSPCFHTPLSETSGIKA